VVWVRRGTRLEGWVDGAKLFDEDWPGTCDATAGASLVLGNETNGQRPWAGTFFLVAIYDGALSAGDIAQNYAAGP
jgi:hypothetical protein